MLEQKRKEFSTVLKEFYVEKRQKIDPEKQIAGKFYDKVTKLHLEFERFESIIETTPYEEFFKLMNKKSLEI